MSKDITDVTGLAVALTATAKTRANQLSRDLQAASRRHDRAGAALTDARRTYARAADEYRALYDQALGTWTADELAAPARNPHPPPPRSRPPSRARSSPRPRVATPT